MGNFIVFKFESHKNVWENKQVSSFVMTFKDTSILEFNQYHKCDKISSVIYADIESLIKRIDVCKDKPQKSSPRIVAEHMWVFNA